MNKFVVPLHQVVIHPFKPDTTGFLSNQIFVIEIYYLNQL